MAVLTLRKINDHPEFTSGREVKISRRSVKATVLVTNLTVDRDPVLRFLFDFFTKPLPDPENGRRVLSV